MRSLPCDMAFYVHAIADGQITVAEYASRDARFVDNPLATGESTMRFYTGALRVAGGSRCPRRSPPML